MNDVHSPAPVPAHRLIPSQFPPIGLFDTVATAADLAAVMELVGWTNDRLVAHRIDRLPRDEWVYDRPNASIVMAAFLHVAPGGMRFNGGDLGAWCAFAALTTGIVEGSRLEVPEGRGLGRGLSSSRPCPEPCPRRPPVKRPGWTPPPARSRNLVR